MNYSYTFIHPFYDSITTFTTELTIYTITNYSTTHKCMYFAAILHKMCAEIFDNAKITAHILHTPAYVLMFYHFIFHQTHFFICYKRDEIFGPTIKLNLRYAAV